MANPFINRITGYVTKPASELTANPHNWRKHPQRQRDAVQASLRELGWIGAVVENVRTGYLIDGHERVWQALKNEEEVPVLQVDLSEAEEKLALAVFDPITYMAETDSAILDELLREVNTGEEALQSLLSELAEDAGLYQDAKSNADAEPQIDKAEELRQKWQVESGQLWQLGDHRLICGDCTDADVVARVMDGERAACAVTSPPYAMQRASQYGGTPAGQYVDWWGKVQSCVGNILADDGSFFVNIKPHTEEGERVLYVLDMVIAMKRQWGWLFVDEFSWVHEGIPGQWSNRLKNRFEPIYQFAKGTTLVRHDSIKHTSRRAGKYAAKDGTTSQGNVGFDGHITEGLALPGNVLEINHGVGRDDDAVHPAKFPVDLPGFFIKAFSDVGDIWFEPFSGSGTTIIACEQLGRKCRAIEVSPGYVAVALQRYADATQKTPVLVT